MYIEFMYTLSSGYASSESEATHNDNLSQCASIIIFRIALGNPCQLCFIANMIALCMRGRGTGGWRKFCQQPSTHPYLLGIGPLFWQTQNMRLSLNDGAPTCLIPIEYDIYSKIKPAARDGWRMNTSDRIWFDFLTVFCVCYFNGNTLWYSAPESINNND